MKHWGQYLHYHYVLSKVEPDRHLILAVPHTAYTNYFSKIYVVELLKLHQVSLLVYHTKHNEIIQWIK